VSTSTFLQGQAIENTGTCGAPTFAQDAKEAFVAGWKPNREFTYGNGGVGECGAGFRAGVDAWYTEVGKTKLFVNSDAWGSVRPQVTFNGMLSFVKPVVFQFLSGLCMRHPIWSITITSMYRPGSPEGNPHAAGLAIDIGLMEFQEEAFDFNFYRPLEPNTEGVEPPGASALREWVAGWPGVTQYISPWYIKGVWGEPKLLPGDKWSKNLLDTAIGAQHHDHLHLSFRG